PSSPALPPPLPRPLSVAPGPQKRPWERAPQAVVDPRPQRSVAAVVFGVLSGVLFLMLLVGRGPLSSPLNKTDVRQERALQQEQAAQQQALQAQREAEQAAMRARADENARQDFERRLQEEASRRQEAERMRNEAERQRQNVQNQLRIM